MFVVLTTHFEYSFDAAQWERKHFKIGPYDYKTRELAANLSGASNNLHQLELCKISKQLSRLPVTLAHFD